MGPPKPGRKRIQHDPGRRNVPRQNQFAWPLPVQNEPVGSAAAAERNPAAVPRTKLTAPAAGG
jgi:hypothetical protein